LSGADIIELRTRETCISCGGQDFEEIWSQRFDDPDVMRFIKQFKYSGDLSCLDGAEFRLVQCKDCGIRFHQKILTDDWLTKLYSEWIDSAQIEAFEKDISKADKLRKGFERSRQYTKHVLRVKAEFDGGQESPIRLLDFGCGDANFLKLANLFAFECFGIDFSTSRQERAEKTGVAIYPDLDALLSEESEPFHVVTLFQTLEHVTNPRETIEALKALLRPDGILIVDVPDCNGIRIPKTFPRFHDVHPLEHLNCFTPNSLQSFIEKVGFTAFPMRPAHVTSKTTGILRTEASRFHRPKSTTMYFRNTGVS
jgi:SAM-dependent methyltransferase